MVSTPHQDGHCATLPPSCRRDESAECQKIFPPRGFLGGRSLYSSWDWRRKKGLLMYEHVEFLETYFIDLYWVKVTLLLQLNPTVIWYAHMIHSQCHLLQSESLIIFDFYANLELQVPKYVGNIWKHHFCHPGNTFRHLFWALVYSIPTWNFRACQRIFVGARAWPGEHPNIPPTSGQWQHRQSTTRKSPNLGIYLR